MRRTCAYQKALCIYNQAPSRRKYHILENDGNRTSRMSYYVAHCHYRPKETRKWLKICSRVSVVRDVLIVKVLIIEVLVV